MTETLELTDEHCNLWRRGCALLAEMTPREYFAHERGDRYYQLLDIDHALTWRLVGPHSTSLFDADLDRPLDEWCSPTQGQFIDWPIAMAWRAALIEATGITPKKFEYDDEEEPCRHGTSLGIAVDWNGSGIRKRSG
jgi:hypothetical protein